MRVQTFRMQSFRARIPLESRSLPPKWRPLLPQIIPLLREGFVQELTPTLRPTELS